MCRKLFMVLCFVPLAALVVCLSLFIVTGTDILPGDYGARWGGLVALSIFGVMLGLIVGGDLL